jgi:signal transduction histidine kinase
MFDGSKVIRRVLLAFGGIFIIVSVLAVVVFVGLEDASRLSSSMAVVDARVLSVTDLAQQSALNLRRLEKAFFLSIGNPQGQADYLEKWQAARRNLVTELSELESISASPVQTAEELQMSEDLAHYVRGFESVQEALRTGQLRTPQQADAAMAPYKTGINRLERAVEDRSAAGLVDTMAKEAALSLEVGRVKRASLLGLVATLLFVAVVGCILVLSIRRIHDRFQRQHVQMVEHEKLSGLGQLAAGMAHEINNPMSYVTANVKSLLTNLEQVATNPELRRQYGESVLPDTMDGIRRVNAIVADVRRFAHRDAGRFAPFNLNDEVAVALRLAQHELKQRCEVTLDLGELPTVIGRSQQITQVLVNLLINAAQAMTSHGQVKVTTRAEGEDVVITVSDNGSGMSKATLGQLFQPFFTTKPLGQGTGLGLAVVHGIVASHGGRVAVQSEPGKGTVFTVRLPATPPITGRGVPDEGVGATRH